MKIPSFRLLFSLGLLALAPALSETLSAKPVEISDVPRNTQMGSPPAPEGAPGKGRYFPPKPENSSRPTIWLIGDSTVRNGTMGDNGPGGQWGWGAPIVAYFDRDKVNVVNRAFGGTSSRTFYRDFFWEDLRPQIRKGDFVIMQFGANDNGGAAGKGALRGTGAKTETIENNGKKETVHTFGWYLGQYVKDTREKGATPIICSLTPRKRWTADGHFQRDHGSHADWAAEVARDMDVPFVNLHEVIARRYDTLGQEKVDELYVPSPKEKLHTGWEGAVVNAECVIAGLKGLDPNPVASFLSERAEAVPAVDTTRPAAKN